jgi:hypothetical protein
MGDKSNDQNWIHISKHIIEIVDLKFGKVEDKFQSAAEALKLREENLRKDLDHLNQLREDYNKKSVEFIGHRDFSDLKERIKAMEDKHDNRSRNFWIGIAVPTSLSLLVLFLEFTK